MQGKVAVAPCGHTGETIIGSYVRCLVGCEGGASASKRGEPGHVLNCACAPCQIRRRTSKIVLRTKKGEDFAVLPWDGVADVISHTPNKSGELTNYKFLDDDGKVIAQGSLKHMFVEAGYALTIKTKLMMDASSQLEVSQSLGLGGMVSMTFMGHQVNGTWSGGTVSVPAPAPTSRPVPSPWTLPRVFRVVDSLPHQLHQRAQASLRQDTSRPPLPTSRPG